MKNLLLAIVLFFAVPAVISAQIATQVTFVNALTPHQVDSVLTAQGVQGGAISPVYSVRIYKVIYTTFDVDSTPTTASGLMVVPANAPCEVPILSFQHDYITRRSDAPTNFVGQWFIGLAAGSLGYITLLPDGIGLGTGPGQHPFLHLQSEATSVIDLIRAVKQIVDTTGAMADRQLFLAGMGEGAYASLAANQYIQTYLDSSMHVTGTGLISGFLDLSGTLVDSMILSNNAYSDASYLPNLLLTYNRAYHFFAHDSDMMIYPYDSTLPPLFNGNYRNATIDARMPTIANHIMQPVQLDSLRNDPTNFFRLLLRENDPYNWTPTSPIDFFYCNADELVPYMNSIVAAQHLIQNGATGIDTLNVGAAYDHQYCGLFSVLGVITAVKRLANQPIQASLAVTNNTSASTPNGTATVSDTLGDPPYSWRWSTGDSTATITHLAAGTYTVTTTDQSHCSNVDSITVGYVNGIDDQILSNIQVYPNPAQGMIFIDNKNSNEAISSTELLDIDGNKIATAITSTGNLIKMDISQAPEGVYMLHIHSRNGSEVYRKVVVL